MMIYFFVIYLEEYILLIFDIKVCIIYVIYNISLKFLWKKKINKKYDEEDFLRFTIWFDFYVIVNFN